MKIVLFISSMFFMLIADISNGSANCKATTPSSQKEWENYFAGNVHFKDKAAGSKGSDIYACIIPNPETYIREKALHVLQTLYFSPDDSIPYIKDIHYTLENVNGISAKSGSGDQISIMYSTQWIEKIFADNDTAKLDYETRGVLYHELTHAYQLEPQECGTYADGGQYWAFIEGVADAVRVANGCFGPGDRPKKGNYLNGYRTTGFFLHWLNQTKDPDFIRKFNRSALEVIPWSFEKAFQHIFGDEKQYHIDALWHEYMIATGDIVDE
jgi:hypothetical protein